MLASLTLLRDVTRWLGLRLTDVETGLVQEFSLGTWLEALPEGRDQAILVEIADRGAFLRYLRILLSTQMLRPRPLAASGSGSKTPFGSMSEMPLLVTVRVPSGETRMLDDRRKADHPARRRVRLIGRAVDPARLP